VPRPVSAKKAAKPASLRELQQRVAFLGPHGLLTPELPPNLTDEQFDLVHQIGLLDKKAHRELGFGTPAWEAVIQLLVNALSFGVLCGRVAQGRELVGEATKVFYFYRNLTTWNRLLYLAGLLIGVVALTAVAALLGAGLEPELSPRKLVLATVFAGLGSLASVLSRLTRIEELEEEHSLVNLFISGASRPIIAAILAVVVSIVLDLQVVTIHVGEQATADARLYLVASFLCGFSERFAKEVLGRILPESRQPSDPSND
jgi:hypothetical protein